MSTEVKMNIQEILTDKTWLRNQKVIRRRAFAGKRARIPLQAADAEKADPPAILRNAQEVSLQGFRPA
jgi:hypothetical protein